MRKCFFFLLLGIFFFPLFESRAEFYGAAPTGFLVLEKNYPYYLYVPEEYTPEQGWPLVVLLGHEAQDPEELAEEWTPWAKKHRSLLLVTSIFPREGTVPAEVDRWIVSVKQEVTDRYRIPPSQIFLVGIDSGAQYAAYLGLRYPDEFSAAALFRRAWTGPLVKLMQASSNPSEQIAFYVAMDPESPTYAEVEERALEFEKKGYQIYFDPMSQEDDLSSHRDPMMEWFLQNTEQWARKERQETDSPWDEIRKNLFEG